MKDFWPKAYIIDYKTGVANTEIAASFQNVAFDVINFALNQLQLIHPRDDYGELLELLALFLVGIPSCGVHIRKPGAVHRAW